MIYSKTCEYAIRALGYLSSKAEPSPIAIAEISSATGVPRTYVAKTFQCLVRAGVLGSKSGPGGGYYLRKKASQLTLLRVIKIVDDFSESSLTNCVMGQIECHGNNPCALHDLWMNARASLSERLRTLTISDVLKMKNGAFWDQKRRVRLSSRMQSIFGYKTS